MEVTLLLLLAFAEAPYQIPLPAPQGDPAPVTWRHAVASPQSGACSVAEEL